MGTACPSAVILLVLTRCLRVKHCCYISPVRLLPAVIGQRNRACAAPFPARCPDHGIADSVPLLREHLPPEHLAPQPACLPACVGARLRWLAPARYQPPPLPFRLVPYLTQPFIVMVNAPNPVPPFRCRCRYHRAERYCVSLTATRFPRRVSFALFAFYSYALPPTPHHQRDVIPPEYGSAAACNRCRNHVYCLPVLDGTNTRRVVYCCGSNAYRSLPFGLLGSFTFPLPCAL